MAPANPGGGWDQLARLMQLVIRQEALSPVPVEVLNRGGAGGAIGLADLVSRRHGDPYTIMAAGLVMIGSTIAQDSPFRVTNAEPLARLLIEHMIVAVPAASPLRTIGDLVAAFRADPAAISWCGGSAGGVDHVLVGLIAEAAGVPAERIRYVAYAGGGEASAAIMGGQVTAGVAGYGEWRGLADDGRLRILATSSAGRFGDETVPTLKEAGLEVTVENWRGVFAPPGLEPEQIAWWMAVLERMRASAVWREYLRRNGWEDGWLPRDQFRAFIETEQATNARTLARLGIGGSRGGAASMGPWAIPAMIGVAGAAAVTAVCVQQVRAGPRAAVAPAGLEDDDEDGGPAPMWGRFLAGVALVVAYIAALALAGFLVGTPVFVVGLCALMRSRRLLWDAVAGVGLTAAVWLLFDRVLHVTLP
jgi:putative tricarboxylic transport membrane protein